eukprot:scaffold36538_cov112-Isochrysis_galbana.AAC.1
MSEIRDKIDQIKQVVSPGKRVDSDGRARIAKLVMDTMGSPKSNRSPKSNSAKSNRSPKSNSAKSNRSPKSNSAKSKSAKSKSRVRAHKSDGIGWIGWEVEGARAQVGWNRRDRERSGGCACTSRMESEGSGDDRMAHVRRSDGIGGIRRGAEGARAQVG